MEQVFNKLESGGNAGSIETPLGITSQVQTHLLESGGNAGSIETHNLSLIMEQVFNKLESGGNAGSIETVLDFYNLINGNPVGIWRKRRLD